MKNNTEASAVDFHYLFGPVPSRRFGLSLGIDMVPRKTCTLDCVFCEVGATTCRTLERREYVPTRLLLDELSAWFALRQTADYITVAGSGEPTLHTGFGEILAAIRARGGIPSALLTNGTLLHLPEVRRAAAKADVVKATLLAWDQASFTAVTRAHPELCFAACLDGLRLFRSEYKGQLWLEVFIVPGINAAPDQVRAIAKLAKGIKPDRVQLNTAVRPTAQQNITPLAPEHLQELTSLFTPAAEIIARFSSTGLPARGATDAAILAMLQRRPCTAADIVKISGLAPASVAEMLHKLVAQKRLSAQTHSGETYYHQIDS